MTAVRPDPNRQNARGRELRRVVWVSHTGAVGGAEMAMLEAIDALAGHGVRSSVVVPWAGDLMEKLRTRDVPTRVAKYRWWAGQNDGPVWRVRRAARNLTGIGEIAGVVRTLRPHLVVSNSLTVPTGALAAFVCRVPHVWYVHEFVDEDHGLSFDLGRTSSLALVHRLSCKVIAVSAAVRAALVPHVPAEKVAVLYGCVDVAKDVPPRPSVSEEFTIVQVAAKTEGKGQVDAVRALGRLTAEGIAARLILIGRDEPSYCKYLRTLISELGLADRVLMLPYVSDPSDWIRGADAVVVCSRREAFGRVTVEAMALAKAVVGSDAGATPELIRHGRNGLLYPSGDHHALADRMIQLHRTPGLGPRLGDTGRRWVRRVLTPAAYGDRLHSVLREAAGADQTIAAA
jgi:glycosyltransferase involved in cell wall biosynthesis